MVSGVVSLVASVFLSSRAARQALFLASGSKTKKVPTKQRKCPLHYLTGVELQNSRSLKPFFELELISCQLSKVLKLAIATEYDVIKSFSS